MIDVQELRKRYGKTEAVAGLSFRVEPGEVVGLLGPNGAGKTTTMEILEGLRRPDDGTAIVLGRDVRKGLEPVRTRMGVVLQTGALLERAKVGELMSLYALMYPKPREGKALLDRVGLTDKRDALVGGLSGGQKQRLAMALALTGDPDLLFLDEPTANLDPQGRALLWDMVRELVAEGRAQGREKAALLTTHSMEEAQGLCSRVAIVDHGKLLAMDTPSALINAICPGAHITFETDSGETDAGGTDGGEPDVPDAEGSAFAGIEGFEGVERVGAVRRVRLSGPRLEPMLASLMAAQAARGFAIGNLAVERNTLADVFLKLTGRDLRDG